MQVESLPDEHPPSGCLNVEDVALAKLAAPRGRRASICLWDSNAALAESWMIEIGLKLSSNYVLSRFRLSYAFLWIVHSLAYVLDRGIDRHIECNHRGCLTERNVV